MNTKQKIAYDIVDFWYTIEFLSQNNLPAPPKGCSYNNKNSKYHEFFYKIDLLNPNYNIQNIVNYDKSNNSNYKAESDEGYLILGKIKREECIKRLYAITENHKIRVEEDKSEIALIGLKTDLQGNYVKDSFNVSPIIWAIKKIAYGKSKISESLSREAYDNDMKKYDELLSKQPLNNNILKYIYNRIFKDFSCEYITKETTPQCIFIYSLYINQNEKESIEQNNQDYSKLSQDFFIEDLYMIRNKIKNSSFGKVETIEEDILDYIISEYSISTDQYKLANIDIKNRIDIRNDELEIEKCLKLENAPIGKWPSKFMPSFMQQIAINLAISKNPEVKNIFSVNGPPGTGKTTLLKDIITENIIKRAEILSKYKNSDDAFEECHYNDGEYKNNGYDKYYFNYYKLKDPTIANYSILVASCNNAAVENITKELPDSKSILNSMPITEEDSINDAHELLNIKELFDISNTQNKEKYKEGCLELKNEIYFSWLVHKLNHHEEYSKVATNNNIELTEWGLISAALGKYSNISRYYFDVLLPLYKNFFFSNEQIISRQSSYVEAVKAFNIQYRTVNILRENLIKFSHLKDEYNEKINKNNIIITSLKNYIHTLLKQINESNNAYINLSTNKNYAITNHKNKKYELERINAELENNKAKMESLNGNINIKRNRIIEIENSMRLIDRIFQFFGKNTEKSNIINDIKNECIPIRDELAIIMSEIKSIEATKNEKNKQCIEIENYIKKISSEMNTLKSLLSDLKDQTEKHNKSIEELKNDIIRIIQELNNKMSYAKRNMDVLDDEFWQKFRSKDVNINTEAQLINPWLTQHYNRQREKLFFMALQVHKEFILSSKSCRSNFVNLSMMWGLRRNSDKQNSIVKFSARDRKEAYVQLLNTLFLLTPVISTTFASVQSFLKDVDKPGSIGTLIIDEAGQASPQLALGALFRCKKAIIVGDPKQVEPVVTDDTDSLKSLFATDITRSYLSKRLSVQKLADNINNFGSYIENSLNGNEKVWVGCPLIVHRRCINPMFKISNELSYGNTMKIKTSLPSSEKSSKFAFETSRWIDISGIEKGSANKNHYIEEQGDAAYNIILNSFKIYKGLPDMYVISPFTTVIDGIKRRVRNSKELNNYFDKIHINKWCDEYCGTVHKFQGKEASEVIFLLGCDEKASGAVRWVNTNIVNVAVTRAKYRLYVIGEYKVWQKSEIFKIMKKIIDESNINISIS